MTVSVNLRHPTPTFRHVLSLPSLPTIGVTYLQHQLLVACLSCQFVQGPSLIIYPGLLCVSTALSSRSILFNVVIVALPYQMPFHLSPCLLFFAIVRNVLHQ